ncbi:hypothetical protein B0H10DRAFT_1974476 [Mycena sp. CBHHK59/15]|nr:hypothetical protein B0H10DRAFT_1974476 [Mycena sp. CBHHK59/15]
MDIVQTKMLWLLLYQCKRIKEILYRIWSREFRQQLNTARATSVGTSYGKPESQTANEMRFPEIGLLGSIQVSSPQDHRLKQMLWREQVGTVNERDQEQDDSDLKELGFWNEALRFMGEHGCLDSLPLLAGKRKLAENWGTEELEHWTVAGNERAKIAPWFNAKQEDYVVAIKAFILGEKEASQSASGRENVLEN